MPFGMSLMQEGTIKQLLEVADIVCNNFIYAGFNAMAHFITPMLSLLLALIVAIYGWQMMLGNIQTPIKEATVDAIKISVGIYAISNWAFFSEYLALIFTNGANEIAGQLISTFNNGSHQDLNSIVQDVYSGNIDTIGEILKGTSFKNLWPFIIAVFAFILNIITIGSAVGFLIVAKIGLAILLSLSPLFIVFSWFNTTKGMADRALSHLTGFAITPTFIYCGLIMVSYFLKFGADICNLAIAQDNLGFRTTAAFVLAAAVCTPIVVQMKNLAASLSQGMALCSQKAFERTSQAVLQPIHRLSKALQTGVART